MCGAFVNCDRVAPEQVKLTGPTSPTGGLAERAGMYFTPPATARTGPVQPPAQWSHAVPSLMPWAQPSTSAAPFMRFQAAQANFVQPQAPLHHPPGQSAMLHSSPSPSSSNECYVYPGDPCSSRSLSHAGHSPRSSVSPPPPYPSYPSTSYCMPRFKRKIRYDPIEQIAAKQLVTEKMVARMSDLSIRDANGTRYGGAASTSGRPHQGIGSQMFNSAPANATGAGLSSGNLVASGHLLGLHAAHSKPSTSTSSVGSVGSTSNEHRLHSDQEVDEHDAQSASILFSDELKNLVSSTASIEQRLALDVVKKSTMALIPWSPPVKTSFDSDVDDKLGDAHDTSAALHAKSGDNLENSLPPEDDSVSSMEM